MERKCEEEYSEVPEQPDRWLQVKAAPVPLTCNWRDVLKLLVPPLAFSGDAWAPTLLGRGGSSPMSRQPVGLDPQARNHGRYLKLRRRRFSDPGSAFTN
jgi:hypothetical protein